MQAQGPTLLMKKLIDATFGNKIIDDNRIQNPFSTFRTPLSAPFVGGKTCNLLLPHLAYYYQVVVVSSNQYCIVMYYIYIVVDLDCMLFSIRNCFHTICSSQ